MNGAASIRRRRVFNRALAALIASAALPPLLAADATSRPVPLPKQEARSPVVPHKDAPYLTFNPAYLPKEVELTKEQIDSIRVQVAERMSTYHAAFVKRNRIALDDAALDYQSRQLSTANDQWHRLHIQKVLLDQHAHTQVIFWMVLLIVAVALILTVYQFLKDSALAERAARGLLRSPRNAGQTSPPAPAPQHATQGEVTAAAKAATLAAKSNDDPEKAALELLKLLRSQHTAILGPAGLQIGSQVVGLVILAFALGFFYLYLEKAFPVTAIEPGSAAAAARTSATPAPPKPAAQGSTPP